MIVQHYLSQCFVRSPFILIASLFLPTRAPSSDLKEDDFPLGFELIGAEAAAAATAAAAEAEAKAEKAATAAASAAEAGAQDGEVCRTCSCPSVTLSRPLHFVILRKLGTQPHCNINIESVTYRMNVCFF
jgi:hypothetical protein